MKITKKDLLKIIRESILYEGNSHLDMSDLYSTKKFVFPHPGKNKLIGNLHDILYYVDSEKFKRLAKKLERKGKGNIYVQMYKSFPRELYKLIESIKKDIYKPDDHELLQDIKSKLFIALENAKYFKNIRKDSDYVKALNAISQLDEMLDSINRDYDKNLELKKPDKKFNPLRQY